MKSGLLVLFLCATHLSAQTSPNPRDAAFQLHVAQASGWKLTQTRDDGSLSRQASIKSSLSVGMRALLPGVFNIHPMLEFDRAFFGSNEYTISRAGLEWDGKVGHSAPAMTISLGKVRESGGVSFTQVAAGAGVTFRVWKWIGVRGEIDYAFVVNPDQDNGLFGTQSANVHIEGDMARFVFGFRFGKF